MALATVGIIANPASGKDIRRVVARASTFDNQEKRNIVRRAIAGAIAGGAERFCYMSDGYGLVSEAAEESGADAEFVALESPGTGSALDTIRAASQLRDRGCGAVLTLGGDGTNRAVALGWLEVPVVPISTGTNNVFPRMVEATVGGAAAGLVASSQVTLDEASQPAKVVHISIDGERDDIALIDAVFVADLFVGARAIWDARRLKLAVLTRAEPAAVGISALGGLLEPVSTTDDYGLCLRFGGDATIYAPIAPGLYQDVAVSEASQLAFDGVVEVEGPGVLAFDGERERVLRPGQRASMRIRRDGPRVIDVSRVMRLAACRGVFRGRLESVPEVPNGS